MFEMTGAIKSFDTDMSTGKVKMTFDINEKSKAVEFYNALKDTDRLAFKISKYRQKRSLDANSYCWALCTKIADKISADGGAMCTPQEIYKQAITHMNVFKDFANLLPGDSKTLRHAWESLGIGWVTEQIDYTPDGQHVNVRCYYGSSVYSTVQMSRFINILKEDCRELGISTATPDEVANMLSLWELEKSKPRR